MKTFRQSCPKTQAQCDRVNTLRHYEAAHRVWMDTCVFTEAGRIAKGNLDIAREKYTAAIRACEVEKATDSAMISAML